jgi:DNA repair exonuclease SbcCD nuclease subunit
MDLQDIKFKNLINYKTNDVNKTKVKYIYHISDIHIHLYKRHKVYKEQFEKLYKYLENEKRKKELNSNDNTDIEMIITITGDILHSKSELSPECIDMTYNFIKNLSRIMPVIIIPGNHDLNMNNKKRLDSISPILADLQLTHPVYYLQNTGIYMYSNIVFMHASIFDYHIISADIVDKLIEHKIKLGELLLTEKQKSNLKKVVLYHGRVNGCELFNGIRLNGEISNNKKTITPSDFKGYDMGLCGDIHLQQNITPEGNIAYAGSLIQQNLGETLYGHGVLKWNVKSGTYKFKEIKNDYGYTTIHLKNGKINNDNLECQIKDLPKNIKLKMMIMLIMLMMIMLIMLMMLMIMTMIMMMIMIMMMMIMMMIMMMMMMIMMMIMMIIN